MRIQSTVFRPGFVVIVAIFIAGILCAGCSDDDPPTAPPGDTTSPTVSLAASQDLFRTDGQIVLTATATDQKSMASVSFYDGESLLVVDDESPFGLTIDLTSADNQIHSYKAVAEDAAGNKGESEVVSVVVYIDAVVGFTNGDFELGAGGWDLFHLSGANGWTDEAGNPPGCMRLNEFGGRDIDPGVTQQVNGLMPGVNFTVSGEYRPYVPWYGNPSAESFVVTVDSMVVGSFARGPNGEDWSDFSVEFTATGESHYIGFWAEYDGDDSSYELDNVVIDVTP